MADEDIAGDYDQNVFVNCPFDLPYKPILNAIVFCIVHLGFNPRLASERVDSGEPRIEKIMDLIEASRFGVHDLSRSQSSKAGELARHNMPLELGLDLGCRRYGPDHHRRKMHLVLEEKAFRHQASISDLSNSDPVIHRGKPKLALAAIRDFLEPHSAGDVPGPTEIWDAFGDFQAQMYVELAARGFSKADMKRLRMSEYIGNIRRWAASR
ncbi:hypothetical protein [Brevundimonas sp.]|uniref:hypothetical protein n=1 Tax=Brevundimonas sp. TaxID=1871086 RepID=UPI002737D47E|nr:hypothetical protein [Brevundimonas sp.]MDP3800953.1 hypothetical protein [Brevundimonas sp.]